MGIFGSIRNAIFGQAREAQTTATGSSTIPPVSGQAQPAATQQPVDVEAVLTRISSEKGNPDLNWRSSIVDLMKLLDLDSSLANRKERRPGSGRPQGLTGHRRSRRNGQAQAW